MTTTTSEAPGHVDVLKEILIPPFGEADALGWMVILHTHAIHLRPENLEDHEAQRGPEILSPLTQRGAAEVMAALWPDRFNERSNYLYWYWQFNSRTPYEDLASVPPDLVPALQEKLARLRQAPRVESVMADH